MAGLWQSFLPSAPIFSFSLHVVAILAYDVANICRRFCPVVALPNISPIDVINVFFTFSFIQVTFVTFFNVFLIFSTFYFKKTLSNAKYKYVKIQRKIFLEDDLAMIFIDFGLLRSLYCKMSYLLAEEH